MNTMRIGCGFFRAWLAALTLLMFGQGAATSLIGAAGFAMAFFIFLSIQPPEQAHGAHPAVYPASLYVIGLVVSAIIGGIMTWKTGARIWRRRNARFEREYVPALKDYLRGRTEAVQKCFGGM